MTSLLVLTILVKLSATVLVVHLFGILSKGCKDYLSHMVFVESMIRELLLAQALMGALLMLSSGVLVKAYNGCFQRPAPGAMHVVLITMEKWLVEPTLGDSYGAKLME